MVKVLVLLVTLGAALVPAEGQLTVHYEPSGMSPPCPSTPRFTFTFDAEQATKLLKGECAKVSVADKKDDSDPLDAGGDRYATLKCGSEDPGSPAQMAFYGEETCATAYDNIPNMVDCGSDYCACDDKQSQCKTNDKNFDFQKSKLAIRDASSFMAGNCIVAPGGLINIHPDTLANVVELPACGIAKTEAPTAAPAEGCEACSFHNECDDRREGGAAKNGAFCNKDAGMECGGKPGSCQECSKKEDCNGGGSTCEAGKCLCSGEKCDGICGGPKLGDAMCKECFKDEVCVGLVGPDSKCDKTEGDNYMMCTRAAPASDNSACATAMFAPLLNQPGDGSFKCWDTCAPEAEEGGGKAVMIQAQSMCNSAIGGSAKENMKYSCDAGALSGGKFTRGDCDASREDAGAKDAFPVSGTCLKGPTDLHYHKAGACTDASDNGYPVFQATIEFFEDDKCTTPVTGCKKATDAPSGAEAESDEGKVDGTTRITSPSAPLVAPAMLAILAALYA